MLELQESEEKLRTRVVELEEFCKRVDDVLMERDDLFDRAAALEKAGKEVVKCYEVQFQVDSHLGERIRRLKSVLEAKESPAASEQ